MPSVTSTSALLKQLADQKTQKVKLAITDIDGVLRGKVISFEKFKSIAESGFGFCDVVFGWDAGDVAYDNAAVTGWLDRVIGWVGLIPTPNQRCLELIYGFARDHWGRGYATEAAKALLAASEPGLVDATIDPQNKASWRILEKLGFVPIGEELDEYGLPTLRLRRYEDADAV